LKSNTYEQENELIEQQRRAPPENCRFSPPAKFNFLVTFGLLHVITSSVEQLPLKKTGATEKPDE
jgi:hypothetical protein